MSRTLPVAPALLALLLLLASCATGGGAPPASGGSTTPPSVGGGGGDSSGGGIEHPEGAQPVLVVDSAGGFVPLEFIATRLPQVVILGDGRVIMQGAQTLEFPGPALPPLIERQLTEAGLQQVLEAVEDTNLFTADAELRGAQATVADAPDTIFELHADGRDVTVTVYALGMVGPDMDSPPGMDAAEIQAHGVLQQLNDALMSLDTWIGADGWAGDGWQPYEPQAFRLYVRDATDDPADGGDLPEQVREWPIEEDPSAWGEEQALFGNGTRCAAVEGDAAVAWLAELAAANQNTRWSDDGQRRFMVTPRPLLPHEEVGCPDLGGG